MITSLGMFIINESFPAMPRVLLVLALTSDVVSSPFSEGPLVLERFFGRSSGEGDALRLQNSEHRA